VKKSSTAAEKPSLIFAAPSSVLATSTFAGQRGGGELPPRMHPPTLTVCQGVGAPRVSKPHPRCPLPAPRLRSRPGMICWWLVPGEVGLRQRGVPDQKGAVVAAPAPQRQRGCLGGREKACCEGAGSVQKLEQLLIGARRGWPRTELWRRPGGSGMECRHAGWEGGLEGVWGG